MQVIRLAGVIEVTGLGRSSIYKLMASGQFPLAISLGGRSVGWVSDEVASWVVSKVRERDLLLSKYAKEKSQVSPSLMKIGQARML